MRWEVRRFREKYRFRENRCSKIIMEEGYGRRGREWNNDNLKEWGGEDGKI